MSAKSELLRVTLSGPMPQSALSVREISLRGLEVELTYALASGQTLEIELEHPILEESLTLPCTTQWCRIEPGAAHPFAGLEFLQTTPSRGSSSCRPPPSSAGTCGASRPRA